MTDNIPNQIELLVGVSQMYSSMDKVIRTTRTFDLPSMPSAHRAIMKDALMRITIIHAGITNPVIGSSYTISAKTDVDYAEEQTAEFGGLVAIVRDQSMRNR